MKPAWTPWQLVPEQDLVQAVTQASKLRLHGSAKMSPWRIWSIDFSEVTTIT